MRSRKLEPWERHQAHVFDWRAARAAVITILLAGAFMLALSLGLFGILMAKDLTPGAGGEVNTRYVAGHKMGICGTFLMSPCMKLAEEVE